MGMVHGKFFKMWLTEKSELENSGYSNITLIMTIDATWIADIINGQESGSENINKVTKTFLAYSAHSDTTDYGFDNIFS